MEIWEKANYRLRPPMVTWAILVVAVCVFALDLSRDLAYHPDAGLDWTLVTCLFAHANLAHLAGNALYLYTYGDNVEDVLGPSLYAAAFLICGLAGTLGYSLMHMFSNVPVLGASGAISGILGMYLVFFPRVKMTLEERDFKLEDIPISLTLGVWFAYQIAMMFVEAAGLTYTAFSAHVGGFVFGALLALILKSRGILDAHGARLRASAGGKKSVLCPSCNTPRRLPGYGRYRCEACGTEYFFDRRGARILI